MDPQAEPTITNEPVGERSLKLVAWQRRAEVLTRPQLPCMGGYHTINLSAGCPNECRYCYAQSYAFHPGWGTVAFYANAKDKLKKELARPRPKPRKVYFSTASEPFLPVPPLLRDLREIMAMLLACGVELVISTKGVIPDTFVDLFARHPGQVLLQVGITTTRDEVRRVIEPGAATASQRLDNLARLTGAGVDAEARIDPLVPGLTDTDANLEMLLSTLAQIGTRQAVVSFLFLRWGIKFPSELAWGDWSVRQMRRRYTLKVTDYCGGGTIWLPPLEYRGERLDRMHTIAETHGVAIKICRCKNSDLPGAECCHPVPPRIDEPEDESQLTLF